MLWGGGGGGVWFGSKSPTERNMSSTLGLGHFQVGSSGYRSLIEGPYTLLEALWKPYIP